jgi:hypothetical protein
MTEPTAPQRIGVVWSPEARAELRAIDRETAMQILRKQWIMTERILWAGVKLQNADDFHVSGFCPRAPASPNHSNCLSRFQVYRQGFVALVNSVGWF